jgi:uncharacterized protein YcbK (DUF882 family)
MKTIWGKLNHFTPQENWGDPDKMNGALLLLLDKVREHFDCPVVIHCGYEESGHASNSQHYLGNAVDFHFITSMSIAEQYYALEEFLAAFQVSEHVGVGVYPQWNSPGFHLDVRGTKARWGAWYNDLGTQVYGSIPQTFNAKGEHHGR